MDKDNINEILTEIIKHADFINIDNNDIDKLKNSADSFDSVKVYGEEKEITDMLKNAIRSLKEKNAGYQLNGLLFVICISTKNKTFSQHINSVYDIIESLGYSINCVWGIATVCSLPAEQIEAIVVASF